MLAVVLVYLRMYGIPLALGGSAHLSVCREDGALCVERLVVLVPSSVIGACLLAGVGAHGWVVRFC